MYIIYVIIPTKFSPSLQGIIFLQTLVLMSQITNVLKWSLLDLWSWYGYPTYTTATRRLSEPTILSDLCRHSFKLHISNAKRTVFGLVVVWAFEQATSDWIFRQFILIFSTICALATHLKGSIHYLLVNLVLSLFYK